MDRQPTDYDQLLASFLSGNIDYQEIEEIQRWQNMSVENKKIFDNSVKSATLTLDSSSAGRNLLTNAVVAENAATANIALSGSLMLNGGSVWATAGKSISFVPSTLALYTANNSTSALAAFAAGVPTPIADPIAGEGVYIFKIVNGPNPTDVFYGILKVISVTPGVSVAFEYRIGNLYAHLAVIQ